MTAVAPLPAAPNWTQPYRLDTGGGYTLVLTQQQRRYTVADLLKLAPQTFVRQGDGAYLLTENIYLNSGAKLRAGQPGRPDDAAGQQQQRVRRRSCPSAAQLDPGGHRAGADRRSPAGTRAPASRTPTSPTAGPTCGRSAGSSPCRTPRSPHLGFWSGRTGGLSLTGTDRPNTGDVDGPTHLTKEQRQAAQEARQDRNATDGRAPGNGDVLAQPSGPLVTPDSRFNVPGLSYVSGKVSQSKITGNAFGLFVSSANGITISRHHGRGQPARRRGACTGSRPAR